MNHSKRLFMAAVVVAAAGCGEGSAPGTKPADMPGNVPPQFILHTSVDAPDKRLNYFVPVTSLAEGTPVDLTRALEVPGTARFFAPNTGGYFSVGSSEDMSITRYDLGVDGSLKRTGVVSFKDRGIKSFKRTMAFISPTKAYYLDESNVQIVVWNPKDLTITGTIALPMAVRPNMAVKFVRVNYPLRPNRLITTVSWADASWTTVVPETGLLVIDTNIDQVLNYQVDKRCRGAAEVVEMPDGDIYFASGPDEIVGSAEVRGLTRPGCMLRVKAAEERFDPSYLVKLSDLAGGRAACDIIPTGLPNQLLFRVLNEAKTPWMGAPAEVGQAPDWEWWRMDVSTGKAVQATELGTAEVYTTYSRSAGKVLFTRKLNDGAQSQFVEVLADGTVKNGLTAPGFIWTAVKVY